MSGRTGRKSRSPRRGSTPSVKPSPLMTADELASWLHCTRRAVYDRVFRGQVPGVVRVGRRLYFRRAEIEHWLGTGMMAG